MIEQIISPILTKFSFVDAPKCGSIRTFGAFIKGLSTGGSEYHTSVPYPASFPLINALVISSSTIVFPLPVFMRKAPLLNSFNNS